MPAFPIDAPISKVMKALNLLGFGVVRTGNHIAMQRSNPDGTVTPLTIPNHRVIKQGTLAAICRQSGISRNNFMNAYSLV